MFCEAWPDLKYFIFTSHVPQLLYYSHIPTALVALLIGFFVYFKNKNSLLSKLLFFISIAFFLWVSIDLTLWVNPDSRILMFFWSFLGIISSLIYFLCLYFVYVFIDQKDISFKIKLIFGILLLPVIIFTPTNYNLDIFSITDCGANGLEGRYFTSYYFLLGLIVFIWIAILSIHRYRKAHPELKKQIILLATGIELFLLSFFSTGFLASYLVWTGATKDFATTQYGLFGMTIFMGFLAYLIVKFKAFDIKLIGAQALVIALIVLIGSLLFVGDINTARVIASITLALVGAIGIFLIRSVKKEVQQREALEIANKEIQKKSDELGVANEKLKQLDRAKTDFINFASHQLRTPITSIKGFSSLLTEGSYGELAPAQKEAVKKIEIVTGRMASLVEDFLSASRIDSGTMKYEFEKCKIEDICQEVATTLFPKANSNKLYLKYEKPQTAMPELLIDGSKTRETISNLVDNAIKYTKEGGVTVNLELAENYQLKTNDKRVVRIIVSDTGIGIPKDELAHLFAKFSRGLDIKRLTATGTGLGLFVGRSMIEKQGGKVWAESEGEGKGSRFIVELPVQQSKEILDQIQIEK